MTLFINKGNKFIGEHFYATSTPIDASTKSSVELIFGRPEPLAQHIDTRNHLFNPQTHSDQELPILLSAQPIRVFDHPTQTWIPVSILRQTEQPRYIL